VGNLNDIYAVLLWQIQDDVIPNGPNSQVVAQLRAPLSEKRMPGKSSKVVKKSLAESFSASLFKLLLQALFFGMFSLLKDLISRDVSAMLNDSPLFSLLDPHGIGEEWFDLSLTCQP